MFGFGEIATAIATWYGYRTLYALVEPNFGLIVILVAFIVGGLVIRTTLNRTFPGSGRNPIRKAVIVYFVIPGFFFIFLFTLFYEKKKFDAAADLKPPAITSLNRLG